MYGEKCGFEGKIGFVTHVGLLFSVHGIMSHVVLQVSQINRKH